MPTQQNASLVALTRVTRAISVLLVGTLAVTFAVGAMSVWNNEKDRRTCGLDWVLWLAGSDQTFQTAIEDRLEKSRVEFERQQEESKSRFKPLELQDFEINKLIMSPMGQQDQ